MMATFLNSAAHSLSVLCLLLCSFTLYQASSTTHYSGHTQLLIKTIPQTLSDFGFPEGLLPDTVKYYKLSQNGDLKVELDRPGYLQFNELVYYNKKIHGNLKFGVFANVSGIQVKKKFLWAPVRRIKVGSDTGLLEFHVGIWSENLPIEQVQSTPTYKSESWGLKNWGQEMELEAKSEAETEVVPEAKAQITEGARITFFECFCRCKPKELTLGDRNSKG